MNTTKAHRASADILAVLGVGIVGVILVLIWQEHLKDIKRGQRDARLKCAHDISADMDLIKTYQDQHKGDFPNKFGELFSAATLKQPSASLAVCPCKNDSWWSQDYANWDALAAAIDGGKLDGEYHYLGAGLSKDAYSLTIVILCDTCFDVDGKDVVNVGLADGQTLSVIGGAARDVKQQFNQGNRPLLLPANYDVLPSN